MSTRVINLSKPPRPDDIKQSLAGAIRERRYESVPHLLTLLTRTAPADADAVYGAMLTVLPGVPHPTLFGHLEAS